MAKKKLVISAEEMKGLASLKVEGEAEKHGDPIPDADKQTTDVDPQYARKMSCNGNYK